MEYFMILDKGHHIIKYSYIKDIIISDIKELIM